MNITDTEEMLDNMSWDDIVKYVIKLQELNDVLQHNIRTNDKIVATVNETNDILGRRNESLLKALEENINLVVASCSIWEFLGWRREARKSLKL